LFQAFLKKINAYPFCYTLPNPNTDSTLELDRHEIQFTNDAELEFVEWTEYLQKVLGRQSDFPHLVGTFEDIFSLTTTRKFTWDLDAVCQFSGVEYQNEIRFDPIAAYSIARRFHHLDLMEFDHGSNIFDQLEHSDTRKFKEIAALLVRQNHYVTQNCKDALSPALEIAASARQLVADFIQEEDGHDLILGKSLVHAGGSESTLVTDNTKSVVYTLKYAAKTNLLAFAMVVDMFERNGYEDSDRMAELLKSQGMDQAAKGLDRHMQINDAGGHENAALEFIEHMAPVRRDYLKEAFHISEVASRLMTQQVDACYRHCFGKKYNQNI
jgi:hypothetical protein